MRQAMMFSKRGTSASEVQAAIAAALGSAPSAWETIDGRLLNATANTGNGTLIITRLPRLRVTKAYTTAAVLIGTASGNYEVTIWKANGSNFDVVAKTGSVAASASTNTIQTAALTASFTPQIDTDYWAGVLADNATVTFARYASMSGLTQRGPRSRALAAQAIPLASETNLNIGSSTAVTMWIEFS